jgi:hypothetical protein
MNISNRIRNEAAAWKIRNNVEPHKLLLGQSEWKNLKRYAKASAGYILKEGSGWGRSEFLGMKIYEMDDSSFIGFA